MKPFKTILLAGSVCILTLSGCGTIFGGKITESQKHKPAKGEPRRKIRPAALAADILVTPYFIGVPIDFITGGMYKPTITMPKHVADSLDSVNTVYRKSISSRTKLFTIYNDPTQNFFCEDKNIGLEVPVSNRISLEGSFATVHPIGAWYVNPLSAAQRDWPGTIYSGYSTKVELKLLDPKSYFSYWGFQFTYKNVWYNNVPFLDIQNADHITYTRNERTTILGFDILKGYETALFNKAIMVDYFFGFGIRYKLRNIDTYAISQDWIHFLTPGYSTQQMLTPTPIIGLRIGLNSFKKNDGRGGFTIGQKPYNDADASAYFETQRKLDSATNYRTGLRVYTDAMQFALNEYNLGAEYTWSPRFTVGANFGISHGWSLDNAIDRIYIDAFFLSPITLLSGHTGRAFIKYYGKRNPNSYWCFQVVYKSLWYTTTDIYYWPRSGYIGHSNVFSSITGQDFIRGNEFWSKDKRVFFNIYYGFGMRELEATALYPALNTYYKTNTTQFYFTPIFDLNIGYKLF